MAKPKPEKKPATPEPTPTRVLPMELKIGDRLVDETGEWEVVSRPYTTAGWQDRARSRPASRRAPQSPSPELGRARARRGEAPMRVLHIPVSVTPKSDLRDCHYLGVVVKFKQDAVVSDTKPVQAIFALELLYP
jgi:hypothetical protein